MKFLLIICSFIVIDCTFGQHHLIPPKCKDIKGLYFYDLPLRELEEDIVITDHYFTVEIPKSFTGIIYDCSDSNIVELYEIKDGKRNGFYMNWNPNGTLLQEIYYTNNLRDGIYRIFHINGQLQIEAYFLNGLEEGHFRVWHSNGQLKSDQIFSSGKRIDDSVNYFDETGQIYRTIYYENGKYSRCEGDCSNAWMFMYGN